MYSLLSVPMMMGFLCSWADCLRVFHERPNTWSRDPCLHRGINADGIANAVVAHYVQQCFQMASSTLLKAPQRQLTATPGS